MKKSDTILSIHQTILTPEEVKSIAEAIGYVDKAPKFTVYHLIQYWCASASEEWSGYRSTRIMLVVAACLQFTIPVFR